MLSQMQRICFSLALLIFCSVSYAQPHDNWQDPQYILKAFKEIALQNEYQATQQKILKWQTPIRYQFVYHALKPNPLIEELFHKHLQQLSSITSLPIHESDHSANLLIHLTPDKLYQQVITENTTSKIKDLHRESHCMGSFQTRKDGEIYQGSIVIPVDHVFSRGLLVSCVIEESTQLMGLPNDSDWVYPSIANDKSKIEFLTGLDYLFLKILYAAEIKAGMTGEKLDEELISIIKKLAGSGEIEQSSKKAKATGLYPLGN